MSYKVYDGIINTTDLGVIDNMLKEYSSQVQEIGIRLWGKLAMQIAVRIFDRHSLWPEKAKSTALHEAMEDIREKQELIEKENARHPRYDFDCKVCLYYAGQYVIGFVWSEQEEFKQCFNCLELVEDYHYQDQTDKPKDIPTKEWDKRGQDWRRALYNGPLTYEVCTNQMCCFRPYSDIPLDVREVREPLRERAKYYARQMTTDMFYKDKEFDMGAYFRLIESDEYKECLEKQIEEVEKQLKPKISFDDLT